MSSSINIILASGSQARQDMLKEFNLRFEVIPADIDEDAIIQELQFQDIDKITEALAKEKAAQISIQHPDALVIGSDQTLEFNGQLLSKAKTVEEAEEKLKMLRGKSHILRSAVCVVQNNEVLYLHSDRADLTMDDFDDETLKDYMQKDPDALTSCVGAYKIEGEGANLFAATSGDKYTIMGMPLIPLLNFLRE